MCVCLFLNDLLSSVCVLESQGAVGGGGQEGRGTPETLCESTNTSTWGGARFHLGERRGLGFNIGRAKGVRF